MILAGSEMGFSSMPKKEGSPFNTSFQLEPEKYYLCLLCFLWIWA